MGPRAKHLKTGSAWERLVAMLHYAPTREGFIKAWTQTCGHPPTPQQILDFEQMVASALGTAPPRPRPKAAQLGLWPDNGGKP